MFNFTTQTVYNYISDVEGDPKRNLWVIDPAGDNKDAKPEVRIGNTRFNAEDIIDIQIKYPTVENLASVTFDMAAIAPAEEDLTARVVLYVGLSMNSQDSFYANDLVYKGKPLFVEFPVKKNETAATVAAKVKSIAEKYFLFTAQEKILNVTVEGTKVTFKGVNGYQQIKKAVLQVFDPEAKSIDCCANQGDYIDKVTGVPVVYTTSANGTVIPPTAGSEQKLLEDGTKTGIDANTEVAILPGLEAFGDYNWIIHNLRLPTLANTNFWAPTREEMPAPGATYVQIIVRLCKERDGIVGEIVGARAKSVTTHVLYVNSTCANDLLDAIRDFTENITVKHDADEKLQKPFEKKASTEETSGNDDNP